MNDNEPIGMPPDRLAKGRVLQRVLAPMLPADRAEFLQHLERKARAQGLAEELQGVEEYRELNRWVPRPLRP